MLPRLASPNTYTCIVYYGTLKNTIQYTQPYNQLHNLHNPHNNTPAIINNAYGIIMPLYTLMIMIIIRYYPCINRVDQA